MNTTLTAKDERMINHFMVLTAEINDIRTYGYDSEAQEKANSLVNTARRTMYEMSPEANRIARAQHMLEFGKDWSLVVEGK